MVLTGTYCRPRTLESGASSVQDRRRGEAGSDAELRAGLHVAGEVDAGVDAAEAGLLRPPAELVRTGGPELAEHGRGGVGGARVPRRVTGVARQLADRTDRRVDLEGAEAVVAALGDLRPDG